MLAQNLGDSLNRFLPLPRIGRAGLQINSLQSVRLGLYQLKADVITASAQFLPSLGLTRLVAALSHSDVDHPVMRLAQQTKRQAADDDFVIWMRREDQSDRCIGRNLRFRRRSQSAQRKRFTFELQPCDFTDELLVRIHAINESMADWRRRWPGRGAFPSHP